MYIYRYIYIYVAHSKSDADVDESKACVRSYVRTCISSCIKPYVTLPPLALMLKIRKKLPGSICKAAMCNKNLCLAYNTERFDSFCSRVSVESRCAHTLSSCMWCFPSFLQPRVCISKGAAPSDEEQGTQQRGCKLQACVKLASSLCQACVKLASSLHQACVKLAQLRGWFGFLIFFGGCGCLIFHMFCIRLCRAYTTKQSSELCTG